MKKAVVNRRNSRVNFILSICSAIIVALILGIFLYYLMQTEPVCSYSNLVHKTDTNLYQEVSDDSQYRYELDHYEYVYNETSDTDDYFNLINIAGWVMHSTQNANWEKCAAGILLQSKDTSYSIDIYPQVKTDMVFSDQSDLDSAELKTAFFTYIPSASMKEGNYKIGILVGSSDNPNVIWTNRRISVK